MTSSWQYYCSIAFVLAIVITYCDAKNVHNKKSQHLDQQKVTEVHDAVSELLEYKIGQKLKEAAKEVKHAVDKAFNKHINNAHVLQQKDADVIIMDPKLSKLVKSAVKEGKKEHRVHDHHRNKRPHGPTHLSKSQGAYGSYHPRTNQGYRAYPGTAYSSSQGNPGSIDYQSPQEYTGTSGYPHTPKGGYHQSPGYIASPGQYSSNTASQGYPQMAGMPGAGGYVVPPPSSVMGGGCPQPCNQNCYSFCPKKCCGGDKRMKVAHHKKTKDGGKHIKRTTRRHHWKRIRGR